VTYHPSPFRMKGAGDRSRRTAPPHSSHVVSAGSVIRCLISNTRRHLSHSYSYVGTRIVSTGGTRVSRHAGAIIGLVASAALVAGCADMSGKPSAVQRLQARAEFERGVTALRDGQLAAALTAIKQANSIDPDVPTYLNTLGLVYLALQRADLALVEFRRSTTVDPDYAEGHLNTGTALAELRQWDEAVTSYQRAIRSPRLTSPDTAHQNLGVALYNLKRYPEAEQALRLAVSLDPRMSVGYYYLGLVLVAEDRKDEARQTFRRASELGPDTPVGRAALERLQALGEGG
jgi:Tfp pilus assembly protein PilF